MTSQVRIDLGERSYDVDIGAGVLDGPALRAAVAGAQVAVVTNETVGPLYVQRILAALDGLDVQVLTLPDGERHKNLATYQRVIDFLMSARHNRTTTLMALGGGVIGDITGFAAATFQRGVNYVQIPTTLLAQVDSSVGGKTAVNHPDGKNMIGAFYQPSLVIADTDVLSSLPDRELKAGIAEVVKYGVIDDVEFFNWLEDNADALLARDEAALAYVVQRSVEIKAKIVAQDERESGLRAILNFGHTFGHAIETLTSYDEFLHGEAVAVGMVLASAMSVRTRGLAPHSHARLKALIQRFDLPYTLPGNLTSDAILHAMGMDKKVVDGELRLILANDIGSVDIVSVADTSDVVQVLESNRV